MCLLVFFFDVSPICFVCFDCLLQKLHSACCRSYTVLGTQMVFVTSKCFSEEWCAEMAQSRKSVFQGQFWIWGWKAKEHNKTNRDFKQNWFSVPVKMIPKSDMKEKVKDLAKLKNWPRFSSKLGGLSWPGFGFQLLPFAKTQPVSYPYSMHAKTDTLRKKDRYRDR